MRATHLTSWRRESYQKSRLGRMTKCRCGPAVLRQCTASSGDNAVSKENLKDNLHTFTHASAARRRQ